MPKLDALLAANGLPGKTSDGLEAIRMGERGDRDQLRAYCAEDVRLLAQLTLLPELRVPRVGTLSGAAVGLGALAAAAATATPGAAAPLLHPPGPLAH